MEDNQTVLTPAVFSFSSFIIVLLLLVFIYTEILILKSILYFFLSVLLGCYYFFNRRRYAENAKTDKLMILTISFLVACIISSYVYSKWNFLNFLSIPTAIKITLVVSTLLMAHLNLLYILFENNYNSKCGNKRIKKEPEPSFRSEEHTSELQS